MSSFVKRSHVLLAGSVSAALLLSACGGGGETGSAAVEAGGATAAEASVAADAGVAAADASVAADAGTAAAADSTAVEATTVADADVENMSGTADRGDPEADQPDIPVDESAGEVVDETATAAADATLESAQSLTIDSSDRGFAKPKVAAIDWVNDTSSKRADLLAKFRMSILASRAGSGTLGGFTNAIKARNPSTKIGYYTNVIEIACDTSDSYYAPAVRQANSANYWLRKANGTRAAWSNSYNHCDLNISKWGRRDSSGRTWPQYKAQFDYDRIFKAAPKIDFAFSDNTFRQPRVDADWKRIGTNQPRTNPEIVSAFHEGHRNFWSALKGKKSSLSIMANADGDLSQSGLVEKLPAAYIEGAMGKSWSIEAHAGWSAMMDRYRKVLQNTTAPNDVVLGAFGGSSEYRKVRYGLASAMMENGWFAYVSYPGRLTALWFDEFEAPIGTPSESPPRAAKSNGVWMRKYSNGLVLVNPTSSSKTVSVGSSYKRLKGTQQPSVNNGASVTSVTIPAKDGLLLINR